MAANIPRKRARHSSAGSSTQTSDEDNAPHGSGWTRDRKYDYEDGDCVVLAEQTLFKIHGFLLTRDSQVLATMLRSPRPGSSRLEVLSDANPLPIHETAGDFRALCWVIYAMPADILNQTERATVNFGLLTSIFYMSHKYQLPAYRTWSSKQLVKHCNDPRFLSVCTMDELRKLLLAAHGCNLDKLSSLVASAWLSRMEPQYVKDALSTAELLRFRWFEGRVYALALHHGLQQLVSSGEETSSSALPEMGLSIAQQMHLYRGYLSLMQNQKILEKNPPCTEHEFCQTEWLSIVHNSLLTPTVAIQALPTSQFCAPAIQACREALHRMENTFADHFLGPLEKRRSSSD